MKVVTSILISLIFLLQSFATAVSSMDVNNICIETKIEQNKPIAHNCCYKNNPEKESDSNKCCKGFDLCTCSFQLNIPQNIIFELSFMEIEIVQNNFSYIESSSTFNDSFFQPPRFA